MAKSKTEFVCSSCGYKNPKYLGKCPECQKFGTLSEVVIEKEKEQTIFTKTKMSSKDKPQKLKLIKANTLERYKTDVNEFDRVMGGGLVVDSVNIITAPPGMGKSTLLLEVSNALCNKGLKVLYISGEESESQTKLRADRVLKPTISDNFYVKSECNLNHIIKDIEEIDPSFIIIDSIQTIFSPDLDNMPGGDKQIMYCASSLLKIAKTPENPRVMFFVGQMTKEDELRGSRELEHMVDAVFSIEAEDGSQLRILRAKKNRFGNVEEIGLFEMNDEGMIAIDNPSKYFITDRVSPVSGSIITMIRQGNRNIAIEIEALTESNSFTFPTRISGGLNRDFVQILIATADKRMGLNMKKHDVYLQVGGGLRVKDTCVGLGIIMSIYSSIKNVPIDNKTVFLGEVSLTGELKRIPNIMSMLKDLERMGFEKVFIPSSNSIKTKFKKLKIHEVSTLIDVIKLL